MPFILALPIFLLIVAILVQYALIANASILLDHAAAAAGRAAVTSLPDGQSGNIRRAACLELANLSPVAGIPTSLQASDVAQALQALGVPLGQTFSARYTYAMDATTVDWNPPDDFTQLPARPVDVSVTYRFRLTVPGAMRFIGQADTVAGVQGRFLDMTSTCRVETAHSRQTASGGGGWPR